jgi:hypothetical protein
VTERRGHQVGGGEVEVGVGGDDQRVLAAGFGEERQIGLPALEEVGGVVGTREDDGIDGWVIRWRPTSLSGTLRYCTRSEGIPASSIASQMISAQRGTSGAGLKITPLPAASAASTPPAGMATGKFQGGTTAITPNGSNRLPSMRCQIEGAIRVVPGEVDRLGDLGIRLGDGLGGLRGSSPR